MQPESDVREQLEAIQRALRRSGREMVLPGTQALLRGILVLGGCAASYHLAGRPWWQMTALWAGVLALMVALESALYARMLARDPSKFVTGIERQLLKFFALMLALGAVLSAALIVHGRPELVAGVWMMLVGTAYVTVGLFSFSDTWIPGLVACLGGGAALFVAPAHSLAILAVALGAGSLGWALVLRVREKRGDSEAGL